MWIIKPLKSSSLGNMIFVSDGTSNLFLDAGLNENTLNDCLIKRKKDIDIHNNDLKILITHNHMDHSRGVGYLIDKYKAKVLTVKQIIDNDYKISDNIECIPFRVEHQNSDMSDCECYNFVLMNRHYEKLVYITDTGYINQNIKNAKVYIIECNYDEDTIDKSKPHYSRIIGTKGHISFQNATKYLEKNVGDNTELVILCHISSDSNYKYFEKTISEKLKCKVVALKPNATITDTFKVGFIDIDDLPW